MYVKSCLRQDIHFLYGKMIPKKPQLTTLEFMGLGFD